jgi:hypothetical protein
VNRLMHQQGCPIENRTESGGHSDAAMRITDIYMMHKAADQYGSIGRWIACRLDDGTSDNMLYMTKAQAVTFQKNNENYYTYIRLTPAQITPCEAEVMLKTARMFYDNGARTSDGFGSREIIKRLSWEDQNAQSKGIVTNVRSAGNKVED